MPPKKEYNKNFKLFLTKQHIHINQNNWGFAYSTVTDLARVSRLIYIFPKHDGDVIRQ
jgi:hypothetical protein